MSQVVTTLCNNNSSIRGAYQTHGSATAYYEQQGAAYRNPHEAVVRQALQMALTRRWQHMVDTTRILDLACGSGEVTLAVRDILSLSSPSICGMDPYTHAAYQARTGQEALQLSFEDIQEGRLEELQESSGKQPLFTLTICSFALHLVDKSRLPVVMYQLSRVTSALMILTPHKRPQLCPSWGWMLHDEFMHERVRVRLYFSTNCVAA